MINKNLSKKNEKKTSSKKSIKLKSMFSARSTEALSITGRSQPTAIVTPDKRINDGHKSLPRHCEVHHKSLPRNMHPMRSFSVPTPPPLGHKHGGLTPKHQIGMYLPIDDNL